MQYFKHSSHFKHIFIKKYKNMYCLGQRLEKHFTKEYLNGQETCYTVISSIIQENGLSISTEEQYIHNL